MVSNFLPPDSQPWVRALENKVKTLETSIASLKKATTSRVSSAITTPGSVLTLGGEKVPGEGVLNGSLEHLNGVYTLRYGHEFHGLTQYVLIVSGKASGTGELSLLGPEGQVLDSDTLEIDTEIDPDVEDATEFYFAVDFPIHTLNYEFEPEDEDGGGPDIDQEVVASYVLPDTGTLSLVTGATLSELSYEVRSANRSQVTIDTSTGVPTITGLSADGTTIDVMDIHPDTLASLEELTVALEEAQRELADARAEAEQNFGELDGKLGQAFPDDIFDVNLAVQQAKDLAIKQAQKDLANLQIGGRNLLRRFQEWDVLRPDRVKIVNDYTIFNSGDNRYHVIADGVVPVVPHTEYTLSVETDRGRTNVYGYDVQEDTTTAVIFPNVTGDLTRTFNVGDNTHIRVRFGRHSQELDDITFRYPKLEKGNKATDWTPAPEDVDAGITDAQARADEARQLALSADENLLATWGFDTWEPGAGWRVGESLINTMWVAQPGALTSKRVVSLYGDNTYEVRLEGGAPEGALYVDIKPNGGNWVEQGRFEPGNLTTQRVRFKPPLTQGTYYLRFRMVPHEVDTEIDRIGLFDVSGLAEVDAVATAAMTMANGKNAVTYTDVANSVAAPGPTPTQAMGLGRRQFDMHRNRRSSNGQIIGEWIWTGTAWTRLTLSDAMLSSLDVGKLTAGTANIDTAVVNKLWGQLGVFDKLDVRTDAYISGTNLKDGAVTARTLNVVPDTGTGGLEIIPAGISIIPPAGEAGTAIQMRVDNESWISFAQNGESTFSVSPAGDLVSKTVSANDSLVYRGSELADLVGSGGQGIVSSAVARINKDLVLDGSERSLMKVNVPPREASLGRRCLAIRFQMATSNPDHIIGLRIRQTQDGSDVTVKSTLYYDTRVNGKSGLISGTVIANLAADIDWNVLLSCWSNAGGSIKAEIGTCLYVEDLGPAVPWDMQTPVSGGGTETTPTPTPVKTYTKTWTATSHRTYAYTSVVHIRADQSLVQGAISGTRSRGHWIFNDANIRSELNGATVSSGSLTIRNQHTYSSSGMTAVLKYHNYSTAPSTFGTATEWTSVHVPRGGTVTVPLTTTIMNGLKAGTIRGFSLDAGSSTSGTHYGYFSPSASIKLNYSK